MFTHANKKGSLPSEEGASSLINVPRGSSVRHVLHTLHPPKDTGWLVSTAPIPQQMPALGLVVPAEHSLPDNSLVLFLSI